MEEDILSYSPTVMFRGTPCIFYNSPPLHIIKRKLEDGIG